MVRGAQAREKVQVQTITDGVIHTRIRGDADLLRRMGIDNISTPGPKSIDIVSVDPKKFESQLVGGKQIYSLKKMTGGQTVRTLFGQSPQAESRTHVLINGGYYNLGQKASGAHPEYSSIGESIIKGAELPESLPIPIDYEADFTRVAFDDGSSLTTGPELFRGNQSFFNRNKLQDAKYQWQGGDGFKPGMLRHAEHPNSRSEDDKTNRHLYGMGTQTQRPKDQKAKAAIAARIFRVANGLMGDASPVGQGVSELRIHVGLVTVFISSSEAMS